MSELKQEKERIVSIDWLQDNYQQHPCMQRVKILKEQLKREKQEDKIFYQSIKAKLATC
jgi:C-terminal processing protease CtpA/Prc